MSDNTRAKIELENVGKLCPICKNGLISYLNLKGSYLFANLHYEFTSCTNTKCAGHVKM